MFFRYGSYQHASGEVALQAIRKTPRYSTAGFRVGTDVSWTLDGALHGDTPAELTQKINLLEAYYVPAVVDAGLFEDSGAASGHYISAGQTTGGWRPTVSWPDGRGAEHVTYRTFSITLECTLSDAESQLMEFMERFEYGGGGSRYVVLDTLYEAPVRQRVVNQAQWTATQSGTALGWLTYPTVPPPLFPQALVENPRIAMSSPRSINRGIRPTEYEISWAYQFASPTPLIAIPTQFPR